MGLTSPQRAPCEATVGGLVSETQGGIWKGHKLWCMRFTVDAEADFLAGDVILKCVALGLRNDREKGQELIGHAVDWKDG